MGERLKRWGWWSLLIGFGVLIGLGASALGGAILDLTR